MKKKLIESTVRKMILEGEMENAEATLAAKDLVDRLQDTIADLGKMANDELPHLVTAIRGSFGPQTATSYQATASSVLDALLATIKEKKSELENATLALTGESSFSTEVEDGFPEELNDLEKDEPEPKIKNPMGRESRIREAKILALKKALNETNTRKQPIKARRLSEALRGLVTEAIKAERKNLKESASQKVTLTTTFNLLRDANFDNNSYNTLREELDGVTDDDAPINLLTILELCGIKEAIWALRVTEQNCNKVSQLMAADFAQEALPTWKKYYPNDNRPAKAIQAARDFANGLITKEQLNIARAAAYAASNAASYASAAASAAAASYVASAAASAAYYVASYASYAAGKEKREQIFRSYLQQ